jgi:hypothetical protein
LLHRGARVNKGMVPISEASSFDSVRKFGREQTPVRGLEPFSTDVCYLAERFTTVHVVPPYAAKLGMCQSLRTRASKVKLTSGKTTEKRCGSFARTNPLSRVKFYRFKWLELSGFLRVLRN